MLALQSLGSTAFSVSAQVHVLTVGGGHGDNMGADGWTPVTTVPDGYVCPAVVNKYNWDKKAAGVHAEASDEFFVRQIDNTIQVKRKGKAVMWGLNLVFPCHKGDNQDKKCQTLVVGGSYDAGVTTYDAKNKAWSKAFTVSAGYTCPAFISKKNWHKEAAGMHKDYDDKFHVRQSGTTVHVRRDGVHKNWGMVLAFDCCIPDKKCDHTECEQWDCSQWCACYEEKKIPIYEQHSCMDDGEECNCALPSSVPAPIISSNQPAKWGQPVAKSEPAKWGSCPNGNKDLAIYDCPKDAGKKCWSGKKRGYFNNGNAETNPKGQCQECPAIDGCQLNRPLHWSKGGGPNFCTCHTCFGQYTDCPKGESCGHTNQITGKNNQRYVSRFLTKDRSQCTLCSTDADDKCAMWGTKYGKKGKEACICHTCLKGWKKNLKGECTQYMSNSFATTGKLTEWKALPKYKGIKNIWKITAADLSRIG